MFDDSQGFLTRAFLQREWALDFTAWQGSDEEARLLARLNAWAARPALKERASEGAFVQTFFVETWGYRLGGRDGEIGFTAWPGYPVAAAGAGGATGEADLALGWFGESADATPQILCEFKDVRSGLDAPQQRKGNTRSPVKQCIDYVAGARRGLFGNEPVLPWWGLVTDMNEFRLYWWDRAPKSYLRFVIRSARPLFEPDLTAETDEARFDRFVFARLFAPDQLLSRGGQPALLRLIQRQGVREKALEGEFYADYRTVRTAVQHSAHPQSHLSRHARSAASSRPENPRSLHFRFLLRGHGRADAVPARFHRRSPEKAQSGGTVRRGRRRDLANPAPAVPGHG